MKKSKSNWGNIGMFFLFLIAIIFSKGADNTIQIIAFLLLYYLYDINDELENLNSKSDKE
jgi:hypothetical protein